MKGRLIAGVVAVLPIAGLGSCAGAAEVSSIPLQPTVVLVTIDNAGFRDVLGVDDRVFPLASLGGAALVSQRIPLGTVIGDVFGTTQPFVELDGGSVAGPGGGVDPSKVQAVFDRVRAAMAALGSRPVSLFVVSRSPSLTDVRAGDELGTLVVANGTGAQIAGVLTGGVRPGAPPPAVTSDSTRRDGVVTTSDIAVTIAELTDTAAPTSVNGAVIRATDAPAPFDLYQRYRDQRRLTVPIGVTAGLFAAIAGVFALVVLALGSRTTQRVRLAGAWSAVSVIPLGLALLEIGRFPRLTYAVVIAFLAGVTFLGATATVISARRAGAARAVVWLGVIVLAVLSVEAAQGWPGAVTPLLGGSQLDGGRFFGLPNAFIGLVLGSAVFVALGLRRAWIGAALLFAAGLVVGSPWTGSDLGGAITMCAAAGLWWGLRSRTGAGPTILTTGVAILAGVALVVLMQRFLASSPTHITRFAEGAGHAGGVVATALERLRIGANLVVTHPFALLPMAGVPVTLWAVLRPGPRLEPVLREEPALTAALVTILVGSIVAYVVNDTGASALGLGFASAVSVLLFVPLIARRESMVAA